MGQACQFCLFYLHQKLEFGLVLEKKSKFLVQSSQKKYALTANSMLFIFEEELSNATDPIFYLANQKQKLAKFSVDLDVVYELCEVQQKYSLAEIASFVLSDFADVWQQAFLYYRLLVSKQNFFIHHKGVFQKQKLERVVALQNKQKQQEKIQQKKKLEILWANLLKKGKLPIYTKDQSGDWEDFKNRLIAFAQYPQEHLEKKYFHKILSFTGFGNQYENQFLALLRLLQIDISWQEWQVKQAQVCEQYDPKILLQAKKLADEYSLCLQEYILDETHLHCYTIDSSKTRDFDDAISIEELADGYTVRLHISDLASFISSDSVLFEHLAIHISSVYTLAKVYHLLPTILSQKTFSLVQQQLRSVLTFAWFFDKLGKLHSKKIYSSKICVENNISYELASKWVNQKSQWQFLHKICSLWLQQRIANGALNLSRNDVRLDIRDEQNIKVSYVNTSSPAYLIVSECAIQANSWAANLFVKKGCAAIFRKQAAYRVIASKEQSQKLELEHLDIPPAYFSLSADKHCSLGVSSYTHITSPIRRFQDLLSQKILLAILQDKKIPFQDNSLFSILERVQNKSAQYINLEKKILNYWKRKYLFQNQDKVFLIKLVKIYQGRLMVQFLELQLMQFVVAPFLKFERIYQVKIKQIDLEKQFISLKLVVDE